MEEAQAAAAARRGRTAARLATRPRHSLGAHGARHGRWVRGGATLLEGIMSTCNMLCTCMLYMLCTCMCMCVGERRAQRMHAAGPAASDFISITSSVESLVCVVCKHGHGAPPYFDVNYGTSR